MALVLGEEQELLQHTVREFVSGKSSRKRIRGLRDGRDPDGFSRDLWREMAALGWLGIPIPEAFGGAGLGAVELMVVLEEMGRGLMPEPVHSALLLGATPLLLGGSEAQKREHLPAIAAGERLVTLAWQERRTRYDCRRIETRAEASGWGWRLTGEKIQVADGHVADVLIVSARTDEDLGLFLVPRDAPRLGIERQWRVDGGSTALVRLDGVAVASDAVLGAFDAGAALLQRVLDRATIGLTAEMLGGMTATFEMTLDYLKTRKQFGVPIGSFQALKHRAARMYIETELARSTVIAAHRALADGADHRAVARLASVAKARCSDAYVLIGNEGVQMHGGIGMTDEHDVGFYLKRARAAEVSLGDAAWHRDRVATLDGY